ncbi:transaldolase [Tistlia consotensis]|uniref:Transaldolase n=1 Tax=Tistlia consotensis USBA 355 TaxID=560819 RepID=A0A1Y6BCC1_9PROT|nr:transaldolase [Tistlia consotensis]SME93596.1 transaldolase [Tistlia consotensis USBA 355]SNR28716.1 transaldolase [Tistlia consotensis]
MPAIESLKVKIFADGADFESMKKLAQNPLIKGFTTNPSLVKKAGVTDYVAYAKQVIAAIPDRPISFEVFADDLPSMEAQALEIATWGEHVNVKIPVMNTKGETTAPLLKSLAEQGVELNVTALFTLEQVEEVAAVLSPDTPAIVSVFAGRIADSGIDPVPMMAEAARILAHKPKAELLWASPREILNIYHADEAGCHIITVSHDVLAKLDLIGKDLFEYSLETVRTFYKDATAAGFTIPTRRADAAE